MDQKWYALSKEYIPYKIKLYFLLLFMEVISFFLLFHFDLVPIVTNVLTIIILIFILITMFNLIFLKKEYTNYKYCFDENQIHIKEGIFVQKNIFIPIKKIYQIKIGQGPILKKYDLVSIDISTAAGTVYLTFIPKEVAKEINNLVKEES